MSNNLSPKDKFFIPFDPSAKIHSLPDSFILQQEPHPLALFAAEDLQKYLKTQTDWDHNFGLFQGQKGTIIGKMFGVLVVKTQKNEIGYLAAFQENSLAAMTI